MNGQLLLLLMSMLMQIPGGEVLPEPNRTGPGLPSGLPAIAPILPPDMAANSAVGWGTDKSDGKFCMIIQIAPEAIAAFAKGSQGQELTADIPEGIRNRIEKVIVRIGSGKVERIPPNPQTYSDSRPNGNMPQIATLENRPTVPIDRSPALFNASGGSGLPNGNGQLNPGSMVNNGQSNSDSGIYPPNNPSNYSDRSKPAGTFAGSGSNTGAFAGATGYENANLGSLSSSALSSTPSARDGFQPTPTRTLDFLQRSNSGAPGLPSSSYPSSQGNYANQPSYSNQGYSNPIQGYSNQGNSPSGTTRSPYMPLAQNANPTPNFNDNLTAQQPYTQPMGPPSIAQSQQYGQPPLQQPSQYANSNPFLAGSNTSYLNSPVPVRTPTTSNLQTNDNPTNNDQSIPKDTVLPLMLLFSIVGNVYLGLWMSYLRNKYRELISDSRGIPISNLSN